MTSVFWTHFIKDLRIEWRSLDASERRERQVVRVFRIEPEQERAGQRIGNGRHERDRFWHRRAYCVGTLIPNLSRRWRRGKPWPSNA